MLNVRSLRKNFDEFNLYRMRNAHDYDIIGISESWIKEDEAHRFTIDNYNLYVQEREGKTSGGVALYVRNDLICSVKSIASQFCNAIKFDISAGSVQHLTGILVYRFCKSSTKCFVETLENLLDDTHDLAFILGDMNLNLFDPSTCNSYLNTLLSAGFRSIINEPTRVNEISQTCIDHFWFRGGQDCNRKSKIKYELDELPFTDHKSARVRLNWNLVDRVSPKSCTKEYTDWCRVKNHLQEESWEDIMSCQDVDKAFESFIKKLNDTISSATSVRNIPSDCKKRSDWITPDIVKLSAWKNKLFKMTKKFPNNVYIKNQFLEAASSLKRQIRSKKKDFFKMKIDACKGDSSKYWKLIKNVTYGPGQKTMSVKLDGKSIPVQGNERTVADAFGHYFSTVIQNLLAKADTESGSHPPLPMGSSRTEKSVVLADIQPYEVSETVLSMANKTSKGTDGLNIVFIKNHLDELVKPLSHLFSISLNKGIFPNALKTAIVVPLLKKGNPEMLSNYRPISILSVLSKIFEKIIHKKLLDFLRKINFFANSQYGFLPGKSTDKALLDKLSVLTQGIEQKKKLACIYFDIAKAFDAVDHGKLLDKLERAGVRGVCLEWFKSYLTKRQQRVRVNGTLGIPVEITCGVPQGSSLGPLLFLVYVNDLLKLELEGSTFSFADDTAIVYEGKTKASLVKKIEKDVPKLMNWFKLHKLVPNADKTKIMTFGYSNPLNLKNEIKLHCSYDCPTLCKCPVIEQVESIKYLGLNLDSGLTWQQHIQYIQNKMRKLNYLIFHAKKFFETRDLLKIYFAIYEPVVRFGVIHWGGTYKSLIHVLEILQRKAVRAIANIKIGDGSKKYFTKFGIPTVSQLYDLERVVFAHRNLKSFSNPSKPVNPLRHSVLESRRGKILFLPKWIRQRSRIQSPYSIPLVYNRIPVKIKQTIHFKAFRKKYKALLLNTNDSN